MEVLRSQPNYKERLFEGRLGSSKVHLSLGIIKHSTTVQKELAMLKAGSFQ